MIITVPYTGYTLRLLDLAVPHGTYYSCKHLVYTALTGVTLPMVYHPFTNVTLTTVIVLACDHSTGTRSTHHSYCCTPSTTVRVHAVLTTLIVVRHAPQCRYTQYSPLLLLYPVHHSPGTRSTHHSYCCTPSTTVQVHAVLTTLIVVPRSPQSQYTAYSPLLLSHTLSLYYLLTTIPCWCYTFHSDHHKTICTWYRPCYYTT